MSMNDQEVDYYNNPDGNPQNEHKTLRWSRDFGSWACGWTFCCTFSCAIGMLRNQQFRDELRAFRGEAMQSDRAVEQ